jgi:hypothetical protein
MKFKFAMRWIGLEAKSPADTTGRAFSTTWLRIQCRAALPWIPQEQWADSTPINASTISVVKELASAAFPAAVIQPLGEGSLIEEIRLECLELLVEQIVGLVDEADDDVGAGFRIAGFNLGLIGRIRPILFPCQLPHKERFLGILPRLLQFPLAKEILVVEQ